MLFTNLTQSNVKKKMTSCFIPRSFKFTVRSYRYTKTSYKYMLMMQLPLYKCISIVSRFEKNYPPLCLILELD